jgi:hypothetical protein
MAGFLFLKLGFVVLLKHRVRLYPFRPTSGTLNGNPGYFVQQASRIGSARAPDAPCERPTRAIGDLSHGRRDAQRTSP